MALLVAFLWAFVPAFLMAVFIYWLDRYEKEPLILLGAAFFWGAVVAAGGAFVLNTLFGIGIYMLTGSGDVADQTTASLVAPFVEEALEGLGPAADLPRLPQRVQLDPRWHHLCRHHGPRLCSHARMSCTSTSRVSHDGGWEGLWQLVFIRDLVVAWQHPFYTAFTGIGLAFARLNKSVLVKLVAPAIGYSCAVFTHAFHNASATGRRPRGLRTRQPARLVRLVAHGALHRCS